MSSATAETCIHGRSASTQTIVNLPESQAGTGRHRCAVCAFRLGYEAAIAGRSPDTTVESCKHGSSAPVSVLQSLDPSQGGQGRHKCVICAYREGYKVALTQPHRRPAPGSTGAAPATTLQPSPRTGVVEITEPPARAPERPAVPQAFHPRHAPDHQAIESTNRDLGRAGELLVLEHEKHALTAVGRVNLAEKVRHISVEEGDGAGYDILSYTVQGELKYIEVKTTTGPADAQFYMTHNEREFAKQHSHNYHLYRVYEYNSAAASGKMYIIKGTIEEAFSFAPTEYRVTR